MFTNIIISLILIVSPITVIRSGVSNTELIVYPKQGVLKFAVLLENSLGICSGVILGDEWILTAAQCVRGEGGTVTGTTVTAGTVDKDDKRAVDKGAQRTTSVDTHVHPKYRAGKLSKYDLAVLRVEPKLNMSATIGALRVGSEKWGFHQSRQCVSYGYGHLRRGTANTKLIMWESVGQHGPRACPCVKERFRWKRLVCLNQSETGKPLCRGDLGSGLVCYEGYINPFQENYTTPGVGLAVYGVAHYTMDKYRCDITRAPGVGCNKLPSIAAYMYLCPMLSWLRTYDIPGIPQQPPTCKACCLRTGQDLLTFLLFYYVIQLTLWKYQHL